MRGAAEPKSLDVPLDLLRRGNPHRAALFGDHETVTYGELRSRIEQRATDLGLAERSLVVVEASNSIEFVVTYLALVHAGHVPLLAGRHAASLAATWNATAIVRPGNDSGSGMRVERLSGTPPELHPDLALLLSTSGSTGAAKLVRLSHCNLLSNAAAIAEYLALTPDDRAITSLPLHYCYGISVLHSHLYAGGSLALTDASVVDPCFAATMRRCGVTNFAGVPHSFDLLERVGPEQIRVPTLRFVTQAGGRLPADKVTTWLERTESWGGVEFFVMYGQTEATARMAYLPPALAASKPGAIGVPIPGGQLAIEAVDGAPDGVGELVYRGPNVMLGYATSAADLADGPTLDALRTGDLARFDSDAGVFEIVGRSSRFVKPFGLRIDLDAIERELATTAGAVAATGTDQRLLIAVALTGAALAAGIDAAAVRQRVAEFAELPPGCIDVDVWAELPRTESGKPDYVAIAEHHRSPPAAELSATSVADVYATVLARPYVGPDDTFVALGGDSLNYVECSVQLERRIRWLPEDWHLRTVGELESLAATEPLATRRRRFATVDTTLVMRAIGICAVVSTHMKVFWFPGGAHLLLALTGYNFSRFQLPFASASDRLRAGFRTIGRAAIPTVAWVAVCMLLVGGYSTATLTLTNGYLGPEHHNHGVWHFWFVEAFVQLTAVATLLIAIPAVRRVERRAMYLVPLVLLALLLPFRYGWIELATMQNLRFRTHGVAWFFVLGWLVHRSNTRSKQLLTTALCLATIPGFFDRAEREWFVALGIAALVWLRHVPIPRLVVAPLATMAAASMWILISHFKIWPPLNRNLPEAIAYPATIAAGVLIWRATELLGRAFSQYRKRVAADDQAPLFGVAYD